MNRIYYEGRQGRRTPRGYKIFHVVTVGDGVHEFTGRTHQEAEEKARRFLADAVSEIED